MIHLPDLNLSALLPIILVAIGSMAILMGEVLLSRADSVLGREVTESFIGPGNRFRCFGPIRCAREINGNRPVPHGLP